MKILSSFKDYYDWMVSKYGIDEKVIYERFPKKEEKIGNWTPPTMVKPPHIDYPDSVHYYPISFCGRQYHMYYVYGDWYPGEMITMVHKGDYIQFKEIPGEIILDPNRNDWKTVKGWQDSWRQTTLYRSKSSFIQGTPTTLNDKLDCPVVLDEDKINPRLSDYGFGKIIPPEDAFVGIYNWLSRDKKLVSKQTDKEKIVSHGFDLKTSFRKM